LFPCNSTFGGFVSFSAFPPDFGAVDVGTTLDLSFGSLFFLVFLFVVTFFNPLVTPSPKLIAERRLTAGFGVDFGAVDCDEDDDDVDVEDEDEEEDAVASPPFGFHVTPVV